MKKIILKGNRQWLQRDLCDRVEDKLCEMSLFDAERKICRKRAPVPVSEWAERHRIVTRGPMEGQRFRKTTVPYSSAIMDASFYHSVEEVVLCAADQVAKSFIIDTCLGYAADRAPGPALIVYPDENTASEAMTDRIQPMFSRSSRLKSYMLSSRDDNTAKRINLSHMQIYAAWARSAIQLAARSIKYLLLDETDKYPPTAGLREADPVSKAEKRVRTFRFGRKIWKCSTPTIEAGVIWQEINSCQAVFEYHVTCPDCGQAHLMDFKNIRWPDNERDPIKVMYENLANYVCPHCGSCWTDLKKEMAVRAGRWVSMAKTPDGLKDLAQGGVELFEYLKKYNPKKIGFHIPSWLSPFVPASRVAGDFLKSLSNKNALKDFNNSHAARPWLDYTIERKENRILALKDDRPAGIVPGGGKVSCLTAGIDTQDNGFWYEIRAWGYALDDLTIESWQVRFGFVESFAGLQEVLIRDRYKDPEGREYLVQMAMQDAMGHRTADVYDFCRIHRRFIIPTQGVDTRRMSSPFSWVNIEYYPGGKKPIPGGLQLIRFDANHFKNILANKLEINPEDPGAWHMCREISEEWARHMCAEYVDEKTGMWACPDSRANHGWDCSVLNLLAAEAASVRYKRPPAEDPQPPVQKHDETGRWIPPVRKNWIKGK